MNARLRLAGAWSGKGAALLGIASALVTTQALAAVSPPVLSMAFGAESIPQYGSTTLAFTISNPNAATVLGPVLDDDLPEGLAVSTPNRLISNTCDGIVTFGRNFDNTDAIELSGGGNGLLPGATCTIVVSVTGMTPGVKINTTRPIRSPGLGLTGNTASAQITVVYVPPPPNAPGPLSGLWWNASESGWGISFTQRLSNIFATLYTYDALGNPMWYTANCDEIPVNAPEGSCAGDVYEVNGPRFFGVSFAPLTESEVSKAGRIQVAFKDSNNASVQYTISGVSRTISATRQIFPIIPTSTPPIDYTDLWWNPNEPGWGMTIEHQYNNIFLLWYVYDGNGKPMWYVASNCAVVGNACTGTLYRTTGPAFSTGFDPHQVRVFAVGTATVEFTDANNAVLSYTVDGVSGTKSVTRELF